MVQPAAVVGAGLLVLAIGLLFMDPDSNWFVGMFHRLVFDLIPSSLDKLATTLRLQWLRRGIIGSVKWFMFKRHPIIQICYMLLICGAYGAFVLHGYPRMPNLYMAGYHKWIGAALFVICIVTFYLASFKDPGIITKETVGHYQKLYPYDNFLYLDRPCSTCNIAKAARSKHCRTCDVCVSRFDHHCIWLNNCVGERNYRWFMLYLIANSILMLYGIAAAVSVVLSEITSKKLLEATFINQATKQKVQASYTIIFHYLMHHDSPIMLVGILCAVMGLVVTLFSGYHMYLTRWNVTTNETVKWRSAWYYRSEAVATYNRTKAHLLELERKQKEASAAAGTAGKVEEEEKEGKEKDNKEETSSGSKMKEKEVKEDKKKKKQRHSTSEKESSGGAAVAPAAQDTATTAAEAAEAEEEYEFLKPLEKGKPFPYTSATLPQVGPMKPNIYDLGCRRNVRQIVYPAAIYGWPAGHKFGPQPPLPEFQLEGREGSSPVSKDKSKKRE